MRWFQSWPLQVPPRRTFVDWCGLIERVDVIGPDYGHALMTMFERAGRQSFGMLEWDVAVDEDDLTAMESLARKLPGHTIAAPLRQWQLQGEVFHPTFGCVIFPAEVFTNQNIVGLKYPTADSDYRRIVQEFVPCPDAHPKHLHWAGKPTVG